MKNKNYILLLSISLLLSTNKIDINNASYDEILSLPLSEEKNKSQQLIIYSLIGGLFLLAVTAYLMFKYILFKKV